MVEKQDSQNFIDQFICIKSLTDFLNVNMCLLPKFFEKIICMNYLDVNSALILIYEFL